MVDINQTALHTYQSLRDRFNDQYMEIQQTKEPSAKQATNWVPLCEIRELMDEYDQHANLLRSQTNVSIKDKVAMQDRFMLHFWTTYPMRNDLHNTRVLSKRMFNALDQNDKDNNNYIILGKTMVLSIRRFAPVPLPRLIAALEESPQTTPTDRGHTTVWLCPLSRCEFTSIIVSFPKSSPKAGATSFYVVFWRRITKQIYQ